MKIPLLLTFVVALLAAQSPAPPAANQYSFDDAFSASSGETLTLQLPASANRGWFGNWLTVSLNSSSAQAKVCFGNNWSTASATAGVLTQLFGAQIPATRVYTASNASGSTYGCVTFTGSQSFNMANTFMSRASATVQNINISVTPLTGTITGDIFTTGSER